MEQRKTNRIPEYDYSTNGAYFVTICTQDRKPVLSTIVGDGFPVPKPIGSIAEEIIRQIPNKYPLVSVDKYVIMPDHIHILLRFALDYGTGNPSPTLGNVIGWYKYQTTKLINLRMNTPGVKHFQRSYYDHVVRNQQDYNEVWEYIENNPQKRWLAQTEKRP
ncbi:MAG: transposase [Oscillospiraceae bacterium]|nr:transposase [Oscillospiraceae bacterium]